MATYLLVGSLLLFMSCQSASQRETSSGKATASQNDYFPAKAVPVHAKHFTVSYHGNYKVVKTQAELRSYEGNDHEDQQDVLVLVQRGTPAPALTGELTGATIIPIPAQRIAVNLESSEDFLTELGAKDRIVAVGGLISYDDTLRQKAQSGAIGQIGYSWLQPPNVEVLLKRQTDLFLMLLANLDYKSSLAKCRQLGIPTAPDFNWAEEHYLGQAEWIKYYALFLNAEAQANALFADIEQHVTDIKKQVAAQPAKPTAIWGYYAGKDRWIIHRKSVETELMADAGLINVFGNPAGPLRNSGEPMTAEQLLQEGKTAQHWIIGDIHSAALPAATLLNTMQAWRTGQLYHNFKRSKPKANAYDWYGMAVVWPDRVLADLVKLTHPGLLPDHQLYFMDVFDKTTKFPVEGGEL
ncbi:ABC transporter substrate-binding protein [Spirosoma aerolatum]|uniref:ABC transporter substrate-binding protein n=1 Tax=Spirosoma aerolatum TaxID=1211326 RepID=UPI00147358FD|nr:ABC transporter substrate-binding protein [Spirosoma aerolatum]